MYQVSRVTEIAVRVPGYTSWAKDDTTPHSPEHEGSGESGARSVGWRRSQANVRLGLVQGALGDHTCALGRREAVARAGRARWATGFAAAVAAAGERGDCQRQRDEGGRDARARGPARTMRAAQIHLLCHSWSLLVVVRRASRVLLDAV